VRAIIMCTVAQMNAEIMYCSAYSVNITLRMYFLVLISPLPVVGHHYFEF